MAFPHIDNDSTVCIVIAILALAMMNDPELWVDNVSRPELFLDRHAQGKWIVKAICTEPTSLGAVFEVGKRTFA